LVYWTNFTHHNEVGFNIPKTRNYARIKHFLCHGKGRGQRAERRAHSVQHHSNSADLSIITSGDDVPIFYLTKSIFFYRNVIQDVGE
jgi:hypothetical protein